METFQGSEWKYRSMKYSASEIFHKRKSVQVNLQIKSLYLHIIYYYIKYHVIFQAIT